MKGATRCSDGTYSVRLLIHGKQRVIRSGFSDAAYASEFYIYARRFFSRWMRTGKTCFNPQEQKHPTFYDWCVDAQNKLIKEGLSPIVGTSAQSATDCNSDLEQRVLKLEAQVASLTATLDRAVDNLGRLVDIIFPTPRAAFPTATVNELPDHGREFIGSDGPIQYITGKGPTVAVKPPAPPVFPDTPKPQPEEPSFELA